MSDLITLPGRRRFRIPTVSNMDDSDSGAVVSYSPDWIVGFYTDKSNTITKGNLGGTWKDYIELLGWVSETGRYVSGSLNGALMSSGSLKHSELVLMLPIGIHGPQIEGQLYNGKLFDHIVILRMAWIEEKLKVLQELRFDQVRIIEFQMNIQYIVVFAQIAKRKNKITKFGQDGKEKGHNVSEMDYRTGTNEFKNETK